MLIIWNVFEKYCVVLIWVVVVLVFISDEAFSAAGALMVSFVISHDVLSATQNLIEI